MSIFSLSWFKSKKEQPKQQEEKTFTQPKPPVYEKPYINIKLINSSLAVLLNDGSIISKANATTEDFINVKNATTEEEIFNIIADKDIIEEKRKHEAERNRQIALHKGLDILRNVDDLIVEGNTVYFKGINRSLPQLMVEKLIEIANSYDMDPHNSIEDDVEYQGLKRFFMWCCLNPRAEVADKLYEFLDKNSFRITKQGFFVALRNVVTIHGSNELVHFVSNTYNKVKAVWKKSPDKYTVFLEKGNYKLVHNDDLYKEEEVECVDCDGTGYIYDHDNMEDVVCDQCDGSCIVTEGVYQENGEKIGNLTELYLDLPNRAENRFTDDWTKTFDIRIGRVVNMPKEDCNWSTQDCAAAGLHFTSDQIHYVGCGDTSVITLINPMKVVGIGEHKGRCYEYLPIMTVPRDEATTILHDLDFDTLELDEDYAIRELKDLTEKVKEGFAAEAKKYNFNIPAISIVEIQSIVESLDEMSNEISNRIINLD